MKKSTWPLRLAAGGLMIAALAGVAFAAGQQGSQSDPLVTLSYLTEKAGPDLLAQVDALIARRQGELAAQLNQELDRRLQGGGTASASGSYTVVTLRQGQALTASAGCELLLRSGTAVCAAPAAPGLIDASGGTDLDGGGALLANHLYLAPADGHGLTAGSEATLLVRGGYTLS